MKETHAYRFVSCVGNPQELAEALKEFKTGDPKSGDRGRNCPYNINGLSLVLTLASGKINIFIDKKHDWNSLKEVLPPHIFDEIYKNKKLYRTDKKIYRPIGTKSGYYEDQPHLVGKVGKRVPSTPLDLRDVQDSIDSFDIQLLRYVYYSRSRSLFCVEKTAKVFGIGYYKCRRRLYRLFVLGLLNKNGRSPIGFVPVDDERLSRKIKSFILIWEEIIGKQLRQICGHDKTTMGVKNDRK